MSSSAHATAAVAAYSDAPPNEPELRAKTRTAPRVAYRVFGEAGEPVLFIMGFGMPGGVWSPQVNALRRDFRCCHYDHLGLGDSETGSALPTIRSMAVDAIRILDDLGWERAHVVGVSMGGMIAQELALGFPERCATLTLVATHGGARGAGIPTARGLWYFLKGLLGGSNVRLRSLPKLLYPQAFLDGIDRESFDSHMRTRLGRKAPPRTIAGHFAAVSRHSTEDRVGTLGMPVLLVRPGLDILIRPKQTDRLAARIPGARVLRFDDAGHGVTFQKQEELNAALREHFAQARG
ncbi:MAG: alpha/beta hydrolase [Myxococcota bacterium]